MSKFQRRHYYEIAHTLAYSDASDYTISHFVQLFEQDNPNFKWEYFLSVIEQYRM